MLLAFRVCVLAFYVGILRELLGTGRVFLALGVVVLAVVFGCGAMGLGDIFVMLVCVSSHENPPVDVAGRK
jgi:hypothetical protein